MWECASVARGRIAAAARDALQSKPSAKIVSEPGANT